jgi:tetratricopeptide (TPR) repeat protein
LTLAVGFTALANVLAAATLVWTEWLPTNIRWGAFGTLAVVWVLAWIEGRADWRRLLAELSAGETAAVDPQEQADHWFHEAQSAYLAGVWVSAEQTLLKLLRQDPRDAEARLLLATLWRHEGRLEAAAAELDRLERLETAAPWRTEIAWERERFYAASVIKEPLLSPAAVETPQKTSATQTTPQQPQQVESHIESIERLLAA